MAFERSFFIGSKQKTTQPQNISVKTQHLFALQSKCQTLLSEQTE